MVCLQIRYCVCLYVFVYKNNSEKLQKSHAETNTHLLGALQNHQQKTLEVEVAWAALTCLQVAGF